MHHNEILGSGLPVITEQLHPIGNNKHETWEEKKKKKRHDISTFTQKT